MRGEIDESMPPVKKAVHLLYVPTIFCNMGCQYCYLGNLTECRPDTDKAVSTLKYALDQLLAAGYLPFNLSFHGGEVTTLPGQVLRALFEIAKQHYQQHAEQIRQLGFKKNPIHIKTNLLNFSKHFDLLDQYAVSISASIDLPLSLHDKYRVDKKGLSTLARTVDNLHLLAKYPHRKKLSCVVTKEHLQNIDDFIQDIRFLHNEIGLDMNRFNVMFSFDAEKNQEKFSDRERGLDMLSMQEQLVFYQHLHQAFQGTALEQGLRNEWFCEFTPDYCCSAVNCGNKFFLLQYDGSVYSCPRGQSSESYYYGNVFKDEIASIVNNGWQIIERNENRMRLSEDCLQCEYLRYCNSGCTFVRTETGLQKSYTCLLQKAIYKDNPERYPPMTTEEIDYHGKQVLFRNNIHQIQQHYQRKQAYITPELSSPDNSLQAIIDKDAILQSLYANDLFYIDVNGLRYWLESPVLKNTHDIESLGADSQVILGIHKKVFGIACEHIVNNYVLFMLLRNTPVVYGDEGRSKQEHIFDYALYSHSIQAVSTLTDDYFQYDLAPLIKSHSPFYQSGIRNNLLITTRALRDYHYKKHQKNAFYHIQAINLPFPNFEFYWRDLSS